MARIGKNQLIKLQKKYKTDEEIGRLYNISRQAVHQMRAKYGIFPVQNRLNDRNQEIRRLYAEGVTAIKMSKKYKLSISQVFRIVRGMRPDQKERRLLRKYV